MGEAILIGGHIWVRVLSGRGGTSRLGVVAPSDVAVHREELLGPDGEGRGLVLHDEPVLGAGTDAGGT